MDLQPTLRGSLVELSPLGPEHFDSLFAVASDPLVWEQHPEHDRYRPFVCCEFFDGGLESGGALIVRDARDGQTIGSSVGRKRRRYSRRRRSSCTSLTS